MFYGYVPRLYFSDADCKGTVAVFYPNCIPLNPQGLVVWDIQTGTLVRLTSTGPITFHHVSWGYFSPPTGFTCLPLEGDHQAALVVDTGIASPRYTVDQLSIVLR